MCELREELTRDNPPIVALLSALDVFYAASVAPLTSLVLAYAAGLWRRGAPLARLLTAGRKMQRALRRLEPHGVWAEEGFLRIQKDRPLIAARDELLFA